MRLSDLWVIPGTWLAANFASIAGAFVVLVAGWYLSTLVARLIDSVLPRAHGVDKTIGPLLSQVGRYGITIFAIVTALSLIGVPTASIFAVLGAAGVAIALALQGTLSNIAAGIMLIWLRPIAIGEYITSGAVAGVVVEIGLFATRIRSTSGLFIFVPNQILWASAITNHSREPRRRIDVNLSVPDTLPLPRARTLLLETASANHHVLKDPGPSVHVENTSGDKATIQLRAWVSTPDYLKALYSVTEDARIALNRELTRKGEAAAVEANVVHDPNTLDVGGHPLGPE